MPLADLYYPEITSCMLCVNAPSVFANYIWPFFRRLISEEQRRRVIIASSDRTKQLLARLVPADEVPTSVFHGGGTCAQLPRSVAERLGYSQLDPQTLSELLINQTDGRGGCEGFSLHGAGDANEAKGFTELSARLARAALLRAGTPTTLLAAAQ